MKPKAEDKNDTGLLEYLEDIIGTDRFIAQIEEEAKRSVCITVCACRDDSCSVQNTFCPWEASGSKRTGSRLQWCSMRRVVCWLLFAAIRPSVCTLHQHCCWYCCC